MGLIYWWARIASRVPGVANFFTQTEPFATIVKAMGGIAQERRMPKFADVTFTSWFRAREPHRDWSVEAGRDGTARRRAGVSGDGADFSAGAVRHEDVPRHRNETFSHGSDQQKNSLNPYAEGGPRGYRRVLLWPDTFNNYLLTEAAKAAVEVLEDAGIEVIIPPRPLCCGRPLFDWGMLDAAEYLWRQTLEVLRPHIRAGTPVVGLEPSCVASFRDELPNLFPHDEDALRLSKQTYLFSEFLTQENLPIPVLRRKAVVHGHCHHKAIMHMDAEVAVLKTMGLDYEVLESGCCGMAGAFGFEANHYDVSVACGERVLLPAVRDAAADTLIIANGFSCREQIEQTTDRRALHLAEVLRMALRTGPEGPSGRPEEYHPEVKPGEAVIRGARVARNALIAGAAAMALTLIWSLKARD